MITNKQVITIGEQLVEMVEACAKLGDELGDNRYRDPDLVAEKWAEISYAETWLKLQLAAETIRDLTSRLADPR